ncbi:gastrotropin-like isoform X2 [Syngnathoides biaculeatus]|uniref:gastrotropin-like isoform X2 n=1 Tax=Syngnathoides biaculeatus TaxID=300417 RepID=UPI002ADD3DAA|nr:gastrotropin-like isoform X2 [Syngnathoides biaculeatus]
MLHVFWDVGGNRSPRRKPMQSQENYQEFLQAIGVSHVEVDNQDMVTDIYQGAYYRIAKFMGPDVLTNTFMAGREAELEDLDGTTFTTTVNLDGGKIKIQFPKYVYTAEVSGDKLVEMNSIPGGITNRMVSKRLVE